MDIVGSFRFAVVLFNYFFFDFITSVQGSIFINIYIYTDIVISYDKKCAQILIIITIIGARQAHISHIRVSTS